ncbi:MAG: type II toxin-antitoxin system PemK/MazF family toxin [Candidatus Xenobiia bacterium LiM19]
MWQVGSMTSNAREVGHVLVISSDSLSSLAFRTVVPVIYCAHKSEKAPWTIRIEPHDSKGLKCVSMIDARRIGAFPVRCFIDKIGAVSREMLEDAAEAVAIVIECL